ncbi:helix-turn-helix domain-containing protein [Streptomyces sp. NPDC058001]|uniref:helix-turn-helix domain-containing protein n=1 Tax=Streptomyces sp. NPDC058001 TaxID=3346300 RepID=UPI0036E583F8
MDRDRDRWARLGRAFAEAREAIGLSQDQVAERIGVTRTTVQTIERGHVGGKPPIKVTGTMRSYARLVGWTEDSITRVLGGGEPERVPTAPSAAPEREVTPAEPAGSGLPAAVELELRQGETLESAVLHLGPEQSDARVIVVLKGASDITPEEMEEMMKQWRKTRRHLQSLAGDGKTPPAT